MNMNTKHTDGMVRQRGIALISALLLLLVVTIMALAMFRSYGVQEMISGNVREKQRALQAAETAQAFAEFWLAQPGNIAAGDTVCAGAPLSANLNQGQICSNILATPATLPWPTAVTYNPSNDINVSASGGVNAYYSIPSFYISDIGLGADAQGEVYQVDAVGYGGTVNAVAEVESTFEVKTNVTSRE
ncbi:MAG TPA: PilX N-terminal domain-containing pilus assembly protein [Steroidobacteraceae bacterium]|nr:PilX N-terminal domain-containing pilus assembly protein [Steroidobacteraceae bacterium]